MANKLRKLFEQLRKMEEKRGTINDFINSEYIDESGNAIVDVDLVDDDNLFSPYSNKKMLNPEILNYIDSVVDPIPAYIPVIINFIVDENSTLNQSEIRAGFKRYYWLSYKAKAKSLRRLTILSLILFLIGVGIFSLYYAVKSMVGDFFASEIVLIASWVFVWEGVNRFFLGRHEKRMDMINEGKMAVAMVTFTYVKKQKKARYKN